MQEGFRDNLGNESASLLSKLNNELLDPSELDAMVSIDDHLSERTRQRIRHCLNERPAWRTPQWVVARPDAVANGHGQGALSCRSRVTHQHRDGRFRPNNLSKQGALTIRVLTDAYSVIGCAPAHCRLRLALVKGGAKWPAQSAEVGSASYFVEVPDVLPLLREVASLGLVLELALSIASTLVVGADLPASAFSDRLVLVLSSTRTESGTRRMLLSGQAEHQRRQGVDLDEGLPAVLAGERCPSSISVRRRRALNG